MNPKEYFIFLSDTDRVRVHYYLGKGKLIKPTAQYETFQGNRWMPVMRYDDAHGSFHRHTYNTYGIEIRREAIVIEDGRNPLTYAVQEIKRDWRFVKDRFLLTQLDG